MKCGNCKGDHLTSAMVLMCYKKAGKIRGRYEGKGTASQNRHHEGRRAQFAELLRLAYRVEPGGYAIYNQPDNENDISFYAVTQPEKGEYNGQTLVWRRASDERIALSVRESIRVLRAILVDPRAASLLFGQKLGVCPDCGRSLTTKESRDRGIGPKCAAKRGWSDVA